MRTRAISFTLCTIMLTACAASLTHAQEVHNDLQGLWRARVERIVREEQREYSGIGAQATIQTLEATILEGPRIGETVELENDYLPLAPGDTFFMNYLITVNGDEFYSVSEPDRRGALALTVLVFAAVIVLFGGMQGIRSLAALMGSMVVIVSFLIPQLIAGASPVIVSALTAIAILAGAMLITHGANRTTFAAFLGTAGAILATVVFSKIAITTAKLTGYAGEETVHLNIATGGTLDMAGIFLGAVIIGTLGILDDVAITQAAAVRELHHTNPDLSRAELFRKALVIGREHVGALVNTLALAYAGAALPIILLFSQSTLPASFLVNRELFAAEIVRTAAGSIGLILCVPLSTAIAVWITRTEKDQ